MQSDFKWNPESNEEGLVNLWPVLWIVCIKTTLKTIYKDKVKKYILHYKVVKSVTVSRCDGVFGIFFLANKYDVEFRILKGDFIFYEDFENTKT